MQREICKVGDMQSGGYAKWEICRVEDMQSEGYAEWGCTHFTFDKVINITEFFQTRLCFLN